MIDSGEGSTRTIIKVAATQHKALRRVICIVAITQAAIACAAVVPIPAANDPELFASGRISDSSWQWRITFTPDMRTAYFARSAAFFPASRQATIYVSERSAGGSWTTPRIAPFSGTYTDMDPFMSRDGRRLYISSIRPLPGREKRDLDLFVMQRTSNGWSEPRRLSDAVNTDLDELYASEARDGTLYWAAGPFAPSTEVDWNIYFAQRRGEDFLPRSALAAINTDVPFDRANPTADWEFNPEISPDGNTLVFASLRPGGAGAGDLYVARRSRGEWGTPVPLAPAVNTRHDEFHPTIACDGWLYFARTLLGASVVPSDFYRVSVAAAGLPRVAC